MATNIGKKTRAEWAGERITPNQQQQALTFYMGIVMDDADDQCMGRLWVYIPNFSSIRHGQKYASDGLPNYGGTAPDRKSGRLTLDDRLRLGWIHCFPMVPYFGSDEFRVEKATDGRNARNGDINSYGMWFQPRIGDYVGVLFDHGDTAKGFWMGCIPKQYRNFMVPGHAGTAKNDISDSREYPDDGIIPVLDKSRNQENSEGSSKWVSTNFRENLQRAGLIRDVHRGAGTSSSRRESPSYVWGVKTAGWSYDAEKYNKNTSGLQFKDEEYKYKSVNTMGHQFVMDDHPDHQGIRLRTSLGSQIYLNDSCGEPYIYITTAKGNVWLELVDSGDINVFGEGSFSLHAKKDINITAGRNINMEAFQDFNIITRRNTRIKTLGEKHESVQGDSYFDYQSKLNQHVGDEGIYNYGGNWNVQSDADTKINTDGNMNIQSGAEFREQSGGNHSLTSGGTLRIEAYPMYLNSGPGAPAEMPVGHGLPEFTKLFSVGSGPTSSEKAMGAEPEGRMLTLAPIVPQHQPWVGRCENLYGYRLNIDYNDEYSKSLRRGATSPNAKKPMSFTGKKGGEAGQWKGEGYDSENKGANPKYTKIGDIKPGEANPAANYDVSEEMKDFLKGFEGKRLCPYRDVGGLWTVGYGHLIQKGDVINGVKVTDQTFQEMSRGGGCDIFNMDDAAADALFDQDVQQFVNCARNVNQEVTQGQFDAMVSLSYNIGCGAFSKSGTKRAIEDGNFEDAANRWMGWNKVKGKEVRGLTRRRREELEKFFGATFEE